MVREEINKGSSCKISMKRCKCGGRPVVGEADMWMWISSRAWCPKCNRQTTSFATDEEAIKAWNKGACNDPCKK